MSEKITFTIQSIRPPQGQQKSGMITTTAGVKLWLYGNKLGLAKEGATYEADADQNGIYTNIKNLKQTAGPIVALPTRQASPAAGSAAFRTPEQMFVSEVLCAYISNGRCDPVKLKETVTFIRQAYNHNWGGKNGDGRFTADQVPYDQAAE